MKKTKILIYDIESSPLLVWTYGRYESNAVHIEREQTIMSFSYKWYGEKKVYHENIFDQTEKQLLTSLRDLLSEADIVVGHNSIGFDNRMVNAGFLKYNLSPPSPYKNVDTLKLAKRTGKFSSNKLTDLGALFGIGTKTKTTYATLWHDALVENDPVAWEKMRVYNNQDVKLTEKLYERLRPYATTHPNVGVFEGLESGCPNCGSNRLQRRGERRTNVSTFQRYQCQNCGHWSSSRKSDRTAVQPTIANYS